MNIWIDLANSPHVLFFKPLISELGKRGARLIVTNRDFSQTSSLCKLYNIPSVVIGEHGGQGIFHKVKNIAARAIQLRNFVKNETIDLALSHNSYAHCIAAKSLGIPYITMMDYEYQPANHINFRLANKIMVPFTFEIEEIRRYGASEGRLLRYPGIKEDIYLWKFEQDYDFWEKEFPQIDTQKVICTIRPPATMAAYHNFENPIFHELITFLLSTPEVQVILFPRTPMQRLELESRYPDLYMPKKAVKGSQLIANSDLVISAGGTMNREASVLGTPVYTVYAGKIGSVDNYLIKKKKIKLINNVEDFQKIEIRKKEQGKINIERSVFDFVLDNILHNDLQNADENNVDINFSDLVPKLERKLVYYFIKPVIPRNFQLLLRRNLVASLRKKFDNVWPINESASKSIDPFCRWPEHKEFALVLTHDVEGRKGRTRCLELARMEARYGFRSSFNFVPERYDVPTALREYLKANGFEVGVHGLKHDGKLYQSRKIFRERALKINYYLKEYGAVGFRSPAMHHNLQWIHDLNIEYDSSTFDTDPFEPQPDGSATIFPFFVSGNGLDIGYIELPYTLPQDFTLFVLFNEGDIDIWKRKLDWIAKNNGMALLVTHPDYMSFDGKACGGEEYSSEYYERFLKYVKDRYDGKYWHVLPRDMTRFWADEVVRKCNGPRMEAD